MGALSGLLVLSFEQAVAAPLASSRLADAGARVIKVERREGDFARGYDDYAAGEASYFVWLNQGKQSLVADLKDAGDAALLRRIAARADICLANLAPGALARAGLGLETMRAANPRLITAEISGYGDAPGAAGLKAYDFLVQAEAGIVGVSGAPGAPGRIGVSLCDIGAGMAAHAAILEALIARGATGRGAALDVPLFGVAAEWMTVPYLAQAATGAPPPPAGLAHPSIAPYEAFPTRDGGQLIIAVQNEREWQRLCADALNAPALAGDARFATNMQRVANRAALVAAISAITGDQTAEALKSRLDTAGIAYGAVRDVAGLAAHPALATAIFRTATGEDVTLPRRPGGSDIGAGTPDVGAHSAAIRREFG